MRFKIPFFVIAGLACTLATVARAEPETWTARWISVKGAPDKEYGVYHFRRAFDAKTKPRRFVVHITADNRYRLFVNGRSVARGPARGDTEHWHYETVDLAPYLRPGRNVLAAVVWNFGEYAPRAQVSVGTGLLIQGDGPMEQKWVDTGSDWHGVQNHAYQPIPFKTGFYYAVGPGEHIDGVRYPWDWQTTGFDDSAWSEVAVGDLAKPAATQNGGYQRRLVPRAIPPMEEKPQRLVALRTATGVTPPKGFPAEHKPFTVAAKTRVQLLLDQVVLTTAYPELVVSKGKGSKITVSYAERLWDPSGATKGHRDDIAGKTFRGNEDTFVTDGGTNRLFAPLWWRTYRYVQVTIETDAEPLVIEDLRGIYTGYPFKRRATFSVPNDISAQRDIDQLLDVGWRTARLCAHETYMDCPYYEQLQYVGDTRVQVMASLYMSGDDRLARQAIESFNNSRVGDGLPRSRHPVSVQQIIPTFSLLWIGMVHDYWWYRDDPSFVRRMLGGVRATLTFFDDFKRSDGTLRRLPHWAFVDYTSGWKGGIPPGWNRLPDQDPTPLTDPRGSSSVVDMHRLLALGWAADLERAVGQESLAVSYEAEADLLRKSIRTRYWDADRKMFSDTGFKTDYSQHANVLAVLGDVVTAAEATALIARIVADQTIVPVTIYFRYYLHLAMRKVGMGDQYMEQLGSWRGMLASGLTTWAETDDQQRSDCHAWGASPNVEMFRTVLGIDSAAPGFRRVRIAPALGKLNQASGLMPHPKGDISLALKTVNGRLSADIQLPPGVDGELVWGSQTRALTGGRHLRITIDAK